MTDASDRGSSTRRELVEAALLGLLAYLPFLCSSPGRLSSDSKQALYVDPAGFLADAAYLWDPSVGAGAVPHQHLGYLWPMAPWFWSFELLGAPDWVAQRLWLGTLTFAAALGARWLARSLGLGRTAALVAALVYALTPYQLAFTARTSVLLLPWVGLPWLVELARRAVARGGWRHPALFALVTFTVAGVNAPSLLLTGLAPLAVLVVAVVREPTRWRTVLGVALRIATFAIPVCAWWLVGLRLQGAYGLPVLQLTEDLDTVAERSSPDDVLRGLGNWFFYGADRLGPSIDQAPLYAEGKATRIVTFALPALGLAAGVLLRWRERAFAAAIVVAATVVAVGAWPPGHPSLWGRAFRSLAEGTSAGLAFRNSPRVVPVLVLGLALLLAAAVAALDDRRRTAGAVAVGLLAVAGLAPAMRGGLLSERVDRAEELPTYWIEAADHLDQGDPASRVLELPGANFAAYRWGNAIEPITPLLIDRPYVTREVLPQGSTASALLVDALDRRLQLGILDPASVAPMARLLGVGHIVVRSDLQHERFGLVPPDAVWSTLVAPLAPGLTEPVTFGAPAPDAADPSLHPLTPRDLASARSTRREDPLPRVAILGVADPEPIVRADPSATPIVLAGDADGIVDAAAVDVVDGHQLVLLSGALDDEQLDGAIADGARLVVTDTNRRRAQSWFSSIVETRGATERAGETIVDPTGYDSRLDALDAGDDARSVALHVGATATATSSGGTSRPEDRPSAAVDGRTSTSWRIGGADPTGQHLTIELDEPRDVAELTLVQPQDGPRDRTITAARVRVDDGAPVDLELGAESLAADGQLLPLDARDAARIDIEILAVSDPGFDPALANAVGFAEVRLDGVEAAESIRLPVDLLARAGSDSAGLPLDLVMTRLRSSEARWQHGDEEPTLDRTFRLGGARTFALVGTVRPDAAAAGPLLDEVLGTSGDAQATATSTLQGDPGARPSRAVDGDPSSAWVPAFGDRTPALRLSGPDRFALGSLTVEVVDDGRHSVPGRIVTLVDGEPVGTAAIDRAGRSGPDGTRTVEIPIQGTATGQRMELRFEDVQVVPSVETDPASTPLPIAVAEVRGDGVPRSPATPRAGERPAPCREGLVEVDGAPVPVRLSAPAADGTLALQACGGLELGAGEHRLRTADGSDTGIAVDTLRLASGADGAALAGPDLDGITGAAPPAGPSVLQSASDRTSTRTEVDAGDEPFWFVLGQSDNAGWALDVDGGTAGPRTLVDGYSAGWRVTPDGDGPVTVHARWTPQRTVWFGMAISLASLAAALVVVARTQPRRLSGNGGHRPWSDSAGDVAPPRPHLLGWNEQMAPAGTSAALIAGAVAGSVVVVFARPWMAAVVAVGAAVAVRWPRALFALSFAAPASLVAGVVLDRSELGWLALGWVVAAVVADQVRGRRSARRRRPDRSGRGRRARG